MYERLALGVRKQTDRLAHGLAVGLPLGHGGGPVLHAGLLKVCKQDRSRQNPTPCRTRTG